MISCDIIQIQESTPEERSFTDLKTLTILAVLLLFSLAASMVWPSYGGVQAERSVSSDGSISYLPIVDVLVNTSRVIALNNLSLGFMLEYDWQTWLNRPVMQQMTQNASFKMVRIFSHRLEPCTKWNDTTQTGTFDWTRLDNVLAKLLEMRIEPLFCLGYCGEGYVTLPPGMTTNLSTGLPYPASWAAYCREWPKHMAQIGKTVRYYEILNEPWMYFGWNDYTKLGYFKAVFNAAAQAMRSQDSRILLGFDGANRKPVLDYWLANGGVDLDFISFHKYDAGAVGQYDDATMFNRAETFQVVTSSGYYGIKQARQAYYAARGKDIIVINSESNFNSASAGGTDPKMQQMTGAVWTALVLRSCILAGLRFSIYFSFSSSASWEKSHKTSGGVGFGMINSDDNKPWFPYYVQSAVGRNLNPNDQLLESTSESVDVRTLAWKNANTTCVLVVCKANQTCNVRLGGLAGQLNAIWIDSTIPWENASVQEKVADPTDVLTLRGYTVMLIQTSA